MRNILGIQICADNVSALCNGTLHCTRACGDGFAVDHSLGNFARLGNKMLRQQNLSSTSSCKH